MPNEQDQLLKLARKLGAAESATLKAESKVESLRKRADQMRELIFANLAGTGSPEERQKELVRLLGQASQRPRFQVKTKGEKKFRPVSN